MRLPTGYGSIIKLGGKRRRPFAVRITAGWSDDGKQRYQYLGYFPTRKEALSCLDDYNQRPYDVEARKITFAGLYRKWGEWKYTRVHKDIPNGYRSAYKYCERLHDRVFADLRADTSSGSLTAVRRATARKRTSACFAVSSTSTPPAWRSP